MKLLRRYFSYLVQAQLLCVGKKTMDGLRVKLNLFYAYRRATTNSIAREPTTTRPLIMATNNSAVFTVLFRRVGQWKMQVCKLRRTSQKIL